MQLKDFTDREKKSFSELLLIMSSVDGDLSMAEMDLLDTYLEKMGMKTLPACIRPLTEIAEELSASDKEVIETVYFELNMLALADENEDRSESQLLEDLSKLLKITQEKAAEIHQAALQKSNVPPSI